MRIEGWASLFDVKDSQDDVLRRGAFLASLEKWRAKERPIAMLFGHKPLKPIGVWDLIEERERGLWVEGRVLKTRMAKDIGQLIRARAVTGLSIGYKAVEYHQEEEHRNLLRVDLWEVSVVTFPSNLGCIVEVVK